MYTVRLYYNTGFNAVNVPDSPTLLQKFPFKDFPALDILQGRVLSSIRVKAKYEDVENADYLCLTGPSDITYYSINDAPIMLAGDVAQLSITLDAFLTIGGISGISAFLDGITVRHHVAKDTDTFGRYTEDDPLIYPSRPLRLISEGSHFNYTAGASDSEDGVVIVESTIDLIKLADDNIYADIYNPESKSTVGDPVSVPHMPELLDRTQISAINPADSTKVVYTRTPSTAYYKVTEPSPDGTIITFTDVGLGMQRARALGVESSLVSQYVLPTGYGKITSESPKHLIQTLSGLYALDDVTDLNPYRNIHNERVLYGECNTFTCISVASGDSATFRPEDITDSEHKIRIKMVTDPRAHGYPSFRFEYYKGDASNFYLNSIKGLQWKEVPLVFTDKSGSAIDTVKFNTEQNIKRQDMNWSLGKQIIQGVETGASQAVNRLAIGEKKVDTLGQAIRAGVIGGPFGALGAIGEAALNTAISSADTIRQYQNQKVLDTLNFDISQNIIAPSVIFPRSESVRDFAGNGCYVYRYAYTQEDAEKADKILTAYGYKDTRVMDTSFMTNRKDFNYVEAKGISLQTVNNEPKWLKDLASMQFANGIRIWHKKPDAANYTDGTNV